MKRLMLSAVAGAALLAGATAANAQVYYDGGYYGAPGPFVERGVGLQVGPVGVGVYADGPAYGYPAYGYGSEWWRSRRFRGDHPHATYNMRAFRAQEWLPQSPPGGGP
jgi:hypothetical protein